MSTRIVRTRINGDSLELLVDDRDSLLEALRNRAGLTGTKEGCNNGNCGACSVMLDGRLVNSCLVMAAAKDMFATHHFCPTFTNQLIQVPIVCQSQYVANKKVQLW